MNREYYEEYCKVYVANSILLEKVKEVVELKEELVVKINKLQVFFVYSDLCRPNLEHSKREKLGKKKASPEKSKRDQKGFQVPDFQMQEILRV